MRARAAAAAAAAATVISGTAELMCPYSGRERD